MTRRLRNRRGSEDITTSAQESLENSLLVRLSSFKQSLGRRRSVDNTAKPPTTFVCYLNSVKEVDVENISETVSQASVDETVSENNSNANSTVTADESIEPRINGNSYVYLDDNLSLNSVDYNADNERNEIIYASVNWKSKDCGVVEVKERFCCDICKTTFLNTTTEGEMKKS